MCSKCRALSSISWIAEDEVPPASTEMPNSDNLSRATTIAITIVAAIVVFVMGGIIIYLNTRH